MPGDVRATRSVISAYVTACALLLVGAVGFRAAVAALNIYTTKEAVPLRGPLDTLPINLGRWQRVGNDAQLGVSMVEELGTSQYLDRLYAIDGDVSKGAVQLHLAYYTGTIDDVPHVPERCWGVHGMLQTKPAEAHALEVDRSAWTPSPTVINRATGLPYPTVEVADRVTGRRARVCMPVGDFLMTITEFQNPKAPTHRLMGGYFFIANGRLTPSSGGVRLLAYDPREKYAYYCKVQVSMAGEVVNEGDSLLPRFQNYANELVSLALPHLMQRLPDWPSVERESAGAAPAITSSR